MATRRRVGRHLHFTTFLLCLGLWAWAGCDQGTSEGADAEAKADEGEAKPAEGADAKAKPAEGGGQALPTDAEVEAQVATFMKDQRKKGCEMLTPAHVARVLEVPEGELDQKKIMGCIYSWEGGGKRADATIMSISVRENAEEARTWFENSTKSLTPEEVKAQMAMVQEIAKKRGDLDTKTKEKAAEMVGGIMTDMTPSEGIQFEDVEGVGDAARVNVFDGSLTVLVGNMSFNVEAYKGDPSPPPDMKLMTSGDMKKITAAVKEVNAKWMEQTRDVRRTLGIELAKAIVADLPR